nr:hypothetical protein [Tanacetum cinerariifolium]
MLDMLSYKLEYHIGAIFYCIPRCTLEKGLKIIDGDGYMKKMYAVAGTYGLIDLYITHIPKNLAEYYYKNLTFNASHEKVMSKVKTHEKRKRYVGSMYSEELVALVRMTLKDFLHFLKNRSASFSARHADVPMSVGSPAGSAANVPDEELEMVVAASMANNVIGAEVVPPSVGRRWRGVVTRPVGSPWRVIAPSLDVDLKGKRVAFPKSVGSPSFKKRNHVVLDEGPSSPKYVLDIAPSDEACKTLFGSLASIEETRSSRDALCNLSYLYVQCLLNGLNLTELTNFHDVAAVRFVMSNKLLIREARALSVEEKAMLVGRSQSLREVASSGIGVELVDMKDFDSNAEENYDRVIESFYQVKFPYVDLLVHYAGQNVGKLMTLKPLIIPFENAYDAGRSANSASLFLLFSQCYFMLLCDVALLLRFSDTLLFLWRRQCASFLCACVPVWTISFTLLDVAAMKHTASNFPKLDKFKGVDFRRWQKKMHFLLSSMSVVYVLTTPIPDDGDDATDSLEAKYMVEDASSKKFLVSNFTNYKMTDSRPVMKQYNELLGSHLRIKESLGMQDSDKPKGNNVVGPSVVNMVEHNNSSRYNDNKGKREHHDKIRADPNKKSKVTCWKCGKPGHLKKDCKGGKVGNKANGSSKNGSGNGSTNSLKGQNMFNKSFQVYYVTYVSKAYFVQDDDVAWLNIANDNIASAFMSTSKLNDSILGHARLGHVHLKRMQDMSKDGLILAFDMDTKKCKTCMLNKITKRPCQNVKRETKILELIHSDLCDLHATPSPGNKKYFVTFIDDASRVPNKRNRITLYELWTKRKPNLNYLRVWGCRLVVRLSDPKLKTLGKRGIVCIFVGYVEHSKAFRFYVIEPNESVSINLIIESKDAISNENRFSSVLRPSLRIPSVTKDICGSVVLEEVTEEVVTQQHEPELRKCRRNRTPKAFNPEFQLYLIKGTWDEVSDQYSYCFNVEDDPKTFDEAMKPQLLIVMTSIHNLIIHHIDVKTAFLNGDLDDEVDLTKEFLSSKFSMKDMGEANVILSIRIKHNSNRIVISQSYYIEKVQKKFNYFNCTLVSTPMDTSEKLMPNNGQAVSQLEYSKVISCLMYAMTCIRPDIAFDVSKLSRYTSNPALEGYTNASWISNTKDNSSTSGWVFLFGGGVISWASKKQICITSSTIESEFVASAATGKEAEWLKNLLFEIPLWFKPIASISIRCDSAATLAKAYSQIYQ